MEYNTQRKPLIIPEYGRAMQEMVDYCKTLQDKEEKQQFAEIIIEKLGILNPHLRDVPDFKHKLWDHLFIMAGFNLYVESPYPIPTEEGLNSKPNTMKYPKKSTHLKYYGNILIDMINKIKDWEECDKKEGIALSIANQMKKSYLTWNKDQVEDSVIFNHLAQLSDNKLVLDESTKLIDSLDGIKGIIAKKPNQLNPQNNNKNKRQNNKRKYQ